MNERANRYSYMKVVEISLSVVRTLIHMFHYILISLYDLYDVLWRPPVTWSFLGFTSKVRKGDMDVEKHFTLRTSVYNN